MRVIIVCDAKLRIKLYTDSCVYHSDADRVVENDEDKCKCRKGDIGNGHSCFDKNECTLASEMGFKDVVKDVEEWCGLF